MEVEEHSEALNTLEVQAAPTSTTATATATAVIDVLTENDQNNEQHSVTVSNAEAATAAPNTDESADSRQSSTESNQTVSHENRSGESDEIMSSPSNTNTNASESTAATESSHNNAASEQNEDAIEMIIFGDDDDDDVDDVDIIDYNDLPEHDPLISSDVEEELEDVEGDEADEADQEDDDNQGEDQVQDIAVDIVLNMINREAAAAAAERRDRHERLHNQINALREDDVTNRDRFNYPLRSQQLLQIRRALLVIDSNRLLRSNQRAQNSAGAAAGENAGEDGDGPPPPAIEAEDDNMGEQNEHGPQPQAESADAVPENAIRFDTNLAAEHSYLGTNMSRVSGVEYLDVGGVYNMMLFLHQHIVYPGEVLPFMISGAIIDADINSSNGMLIGICFPFMRNKKIEHSIYGVTCQIYEKGTDVRGHTLIKSRALQRFVTTSETQTEHLEFINENPRLKHGYVRILPEHYMREPLKCINMGSMNRFRDIASMEQQFKRFQAATTSWPPHVYDYYNMTSIVEKARKSLAQHEIDTMPTDPIQLSFWLARNLHLSEELMKSIFMNDTVNQRMKLIDSTFKEKSIFVCRICGNRIANCSELFAMSKHGVQTQYCNSAGYIHETNTVYQLLRDAVSYSGAPSSEFSWFPGYQWHIIVCKVCTRHIGWEFKALESNLVPKVFFGISSSSVRVSDFTGAPTNPREEIFRNFMRLARREFQ